MVKSLQQFAKQSSLRAVDWRQFGADMNYLHTLKNMERYVAAIHRQEEAEQIWLLEHPPLYTAGTSARWTDLLSHQRFPVFDVGRGGQYTYHGPGQRICYVMLDLNQRGKDVRTLITSLEAWVIKTLEHFDVVGEIRDERVGVWVARPDKPPVNSRICEDKIAAIGIRLRRWVSFHGLSLNVCPDLEHYSGIVPCGITGEASGHGVTSLHDLGIDVSIQEVDSALKDAFTEVFGSPVNEIMEDRTSL
ncbi:MAG: lipoyl(octanoyl) transferase LipB [bacterium]|nr:lipoyl(octanoyl) transferase LipB [bacterium]